MVPVAEPSCQASGDGHGQHDGQHQAVVAGHLDYAGDGRQGCLRGCGEDCCHGDDPVNGGLSGRRAKDVIGAVFADLLRTADDR